jgi:ketosteroid isomerase-like protein
LTRPPRWHNIGLSFSGKVTMRRAITMAALAVGLMAAACGGAKTEEFTTTDAAAIRRVDADFVTAFNAKDMDKILAFYAENSVFMPPNKPTLRGREPLKSFYVDLFGQGATDLKLEPDEVSGHGPIAYQSGTYSLSTGATHDRGKFLFVMRKMGDRWVYQHSIWSSDLPKPVG